MLDKFPSKKYVVNVNYSVDVNVIGEDIITYKDRIA